MTNFLSYVKENMGWPSMPSPKQTNKKEMVYKVSCRITNTKNWKSFVFTDALFADHSIDPDKQINNVMSRLADEHEVFEDWPLPKKGPKPNPCAVGAGAEQYESDYAEFKLTIMFIPHNTIYRPNLDKNERLYIRNDEYGELNASERTAKLEKMKETGFDEYCRELGLGKFVYSRYV